MARGWESKSVESQLDDHSNQTDAMKAAALAAAREIEQKIESLELSRTRVMHDLSTACNPRYRGQLEGALAHLDGAIAALRKPH